VKLTTANLTRHEYLKHQHIYPQVPPVYTNPCLQCRKLTHKSKIFCCRSCAGTYNNARKDYTKFKSGPEPGYKPVNTKPLYTPVGQCVACSKWFANKGKAGRKKTCSTKCYSARLSAVATANPEMGGNKNNYAHGWYESPTAGRVWLESSYELKVANELDNNNIKWVRPDYLPYGRNKKYFADFYLIEHNVYLDPKNDYLIVQDANKIASVVKENKVEIIVLNKKQLTWDCIKSLMS
jgi:hypothetical protein